MPRCPRCRAINSTESKFCVRCGLSFDVEPEKPKHEIPDVYPSSSDIIQTASPVHDSFEPTAFPADQTPPATSAWADQRGPATGPSALEQLSAEGLDQEYPLDQSVDTGQDAPSAIEDAEAPVRSTTVTEETLRHFGSEPSLIGDVFMARDMAAERPDFDPFLWLSRFMGLMFFVEALVFFIWGAYRHYGVIILAGLVICFFLLSRFLGNIFLFSLLGAGRLLGSLFRSDEQQVPVRMLRLMDSEQREHIVRIKGRLIRGDIAEHDRVAIWGRRRQGTLLFQYGYNLWARSSIKLEGRYTWILALILGTLACWLLFELFLMYQGA